MIHNNQIDLHQYNKLKLGKLCIQQRMSVSMKMDCMILLGKALVELFLMDSNVTLYMTSVESSHSRHQLGMQCRSQGLWLRTRYHLGKVKEMLILQGNNNQLGSSRHLVKQGCLRLWLLQCNSNQQHKDLLELRGLL